MQEQALIDTARALVAHGKGILAADESNPTAEKRLASINVESTEQTRQAFRQMLFTAEGVEQFLSGVILFEETLFQSTDDGTPFPKLLADRGIIPGIKVDKGAKPLAAGGDEKVTEGLDGLRERLATYREHGARFAKWRAVIDIAEDLPSDYAIEANAHALARYAALCQEAGIVPIVEPEVMMDGAHSLADCERASSRTLAALFNQLKTQRVMLEGLLLKPNMVISGKGCSEQASVEQVAEATLRCFSSPRAGGGAGDRIPVRRPGRGVGDRAPERHERARTAAVDHLVFLQPGVAGAGACRLARRARQRGGRTESAVSARAQQLRGGARRI